MRSSRASLLDLPTLKHRLKNEPCSNLIADCKEFPQDSIMQIMASFWMMSEAVLDEHPNQLHHQLFGRLGIYVDLYPEIADLLATVRQDTSGLQLLQPTLQPAYRGLDQLLRGHTEQVVGALVLSNDTLLTWSWDETLRLWSADGELLIIMEGHTDFIDEAIELSTGRILSWSHTRTNNWYERVTTLRLWSLEGELLAVLDGHEGKVSDVTELPNGNILTKVYREQYYLLWNSDGCLINKIDLINERTHIAKILDNRLIIYDHPIPYMYTFDGKYIGTNRRIPTTIFSERAIQLQNGWWITCLEMTLFFYDGLESTRYQVNLSEGELEYYIKSIIQLKDSRLLVYCEYFRRRREYKGSLYLLTSDGQQLKHIEYPNNRIRHIEELHDGRLLMLMDDKIPELWSPKLEHIKTLEGHSRRIRDMIELKDSRLITFSSDETIRLWTSDGDALGIIGGQADSVLCAGVLADGRLVSYANSEFSYDRTVSIWNLDADETRLSPHHTAYPYSILELKDGRLLSCSWDASMMMWSPNGSLIKKIWSKHMGTIYNALELHDGRILAWASGTATIWSKDGEFVEIAEHKISEAIRLQCGHIVTTDGEVLRICTANLIELYVLDGHEQTVSGMLELQDERILSWGGRYRGEENPTLRLWTADGEPLAVMEGHTQGIIGALELSDGRLLSWSIDKTLRIWTSDGEPLAVLVGHEQRISQVFELADHRILSSYQSIDGNIKSENMLWTSDGQFIRQVAEDRGYLISKGQKEVYWNTDVRRIKGFKDGELVHEFVADTYIYAHCGTRDGGVVLGDYCGNIHILKPTQGRN